ncbi:class A beta-lactamase-related serine hydrolase [Aquimarina sp. AD1]|uniref:serine hydrolase domain-containing protein n=1 Tax=Aquimarina sp. (strain AD1) TaxID=1714848 RepID=UPI000E49F9D7|nr:serine hydrolase domain-containing protein [Aquimarina sp. AD1]AXT57601.1 class A beta-lactamase-related serine hydrolase [Aquimarina sp. AD1]RKN13896.1 class A beta-lactamase-related serine hydrolase [Aquimarina sp. AD1]
MKKYIKICSIFILALVLAYYLFEPIFVYTIGWKNKPNTSNIQPVQIHNDLILKKADSILKAIYTKLDAPAVSIAVGQNNKVIWSNVIGYQNIEDKTLANLTTKFRIGSTSKAVTSLGIGVLLQNNKLNLDHQVKQFVSYVDKPLKDLTLKQLGSHTSGIRNYGACLCFPIWEYYNNDSYSSVEESVSLFNNDELLFTPGNNFSYSSYNYTLLSAMIEEASGKPFPEFMKESVFEPLRATFIVEETSETIKDAAEFYDVTNQKYKKVYPVNNSNKWAGGGFLASPTDLIKLGNAFLNNELFDKNTTDLLTAPVMLNNSKVNEQNYAIGWRNDAKDIFNNGTTIRVWHHGGIANGSISLLALFPEYNLSISMLANKNGSSSDLFENVYAIAKIFINQKNLTR